MLALSAALAAACFVKAFGVTFSAAAPQPLRRPAGGRPLSLAGCSFRRPCVCYSDRNIPAPIIDTLARS